MRILHTSDWHLGGTLEGVSREGDHAAFLSWLAETIEREQIDVLVIAGDVFDQAHPSSEAQRLYYRFLRRLSGGALSKVVVVGGNHDSAARLDAPRELLETLDVHVVGGVSLEDRERCFCPIQGKTGGVELVALAVPFVHEYRLGVRTALASTEEIRAAFTDRFRDFYRELVDEAQVRFEGAPIIATGHLTCGAYEAGDFPVDVHMVGSIGGLPSSIFDERLQYVALGHIHRSYRIGESRAYYSGSPITLSLQEARTARSVRIVEVGEATRPEDVRRLEVPCFRDVLELAGPLEEVAERLRAMTWDHALAPLIYARVEVERYTQKADERIRAALLAHGERAPILAQLRQQIVRDDAPAVSSAPVKSLRELSPEEVFTRLCAEENVPVDAPLLNAFRALLANDDDERGVA